MMRHDASCFVLQLVVLLYEKSVFKENGPRRLAGGTVLERTQPISWCRYVCWDTRTMAMMDSIINNR